MGSTAADRTPRPPALAAAPLVAEAAGTFALVFAACGSIMVNAEGDILGQIGMALAPGLAVAVMVASLGHVSGAHLNPAVTLGMWARDRIPGRRVAPYIAAQIAGAAAAALLLRASLGDVAGIGATVPSGSDRQAFMWEVLLTAMLMLVILAVATDPRAAGQPAAFAIGGTVALAALVGGPISGASMNPARTLGPVIAGGPSTGLWVYLTAPLVGAAVAIGLHVAMRTRTHREATE